MTHFTIAFVVFSSLVWHVSDGITQQTRTSGVLANQAGQQEPNPAGQTPKFGVPRSWRATGIICSRSTQPTTVQAKPGFVLLAIQVGVQEGDSIFSYFGNAEAVMTMDKDGNWGPPAGVIFKGKEGDKGMTITSYKATLLGSGDTKYSPVVAAMQGVGYVADRADSQAFFDRMDLATTEAPELSAMAPRGMILLVYEVPAGQVEFKLKIGDSEPIAIVVKEK